jgi:hypothetical protein
MSDAARTPPFRPAVVIGLGAMGTFFAWNIKRKVEEQLDRQVQLGVITPEQRDEAMSTRFQFIGVDPI